jgi:hypothetical protein
MAKNRIDCAQLFFENISKWLNDAELHSGWENKDFKRISGSLTTGICTARIEIVFCPNDLKCRVPIVFCDEEWITRELDWHCFRGTSGYESWREKDRLCWIHPHEWAKAHCHRLKRLTCVVDEGSEWLKNNVSKLLERHRIGHTLGIKKWKSEWGGWAHGQLGTDQYLSELKEAGHPRNWEKIQNGSSI